jgi:mono/diheme cytochrome c family protein
MDVKLKLLVVSLMCALSVPLVSALPHSADSPKASSELVAEGRMIYSGQCSRCHGYDMNNAGLVGYDLRKFSKEDEDRFFNSVRNGKPPIMPPWGDVLSTREIEALWAYVQTKGVP